MIAERTWQRSECRAMAHGLGRGWRERGPERGPARAGQTHVAGAEIHGPAPRRRRLRALEPAAPREAVAVDVAVAGAGARCGGRGGGEVMLGEEGGIEGDGILPGRGTGDRTQGTGDRGRGAGGGGREDKGGGGEGAGGLAA